MSVVSLLLTTHSDSGCGQVLSTVDGRPSPVDHAQCTALYTARWPIGREVAHHTGPLAETWLGLLSVCLWSVAAK